MKLQQLRYVLEIVRHGNHLSAAAKALHTSQPGVSRQVQLLEAELGFGVFVRTRNRIIGLSEPGLEVLAIAKRLAADMSALRALKDDINGGNRGTLTIATTHTQARYVLPNVIKTFISAYPEVRLVLKQGDPEEICGLVDSGDADLAIGTETTRRYPDLVRLECYKLERSVVAKVGHPVLDVEPLTLEAIAAYPIITYGPRYSGYRKVMKAFKDAGIEPKIILSVIDADVSKTYVEMGLGIAILTTITVEPTRDVGIRARDAHHLFESSTVAITLPSNTYVRPFILDFIRATAAHLTPAVVREALRNTSRPATRP
jgi:LysR family transcriptional regulator, cys regulon transcriptional activator